MTKYFFRPGCGNCDSVTLPEDGVIKIDVTSPDYIGLVPPRVPTVQFGGVILEGAEQINDYFYFAKQIN